MGKLEYKGACLCGQTSYSVQDHPDNPHLCSCLMCQKSSGAPTVAWVDFPLAFFLWTGLMPQLYQSSTNTKRCFCEKCGCLLAAINEGSKSICLTIASLENSNLIAPNRNHSFKESAPKWWDPKIKRVDS